MRAGSCAKRTDLPTSPRRVLFQLMGLVFFLGFSFQVQALGPVSMEALLGTTGARMHWDPFLHIGRLSKDGTVLVFRPGEPWMVLNGTTLVTTGTVLEEEGRLVFSEEAAATIYETFGVEEFSAIPYRLTTILIDPGHGGRDSGAQRSWPIDGVNYPLLEKDIVLEVSLRLVDALEERYPDKEILLTRDTDVYPTLEERVEMANGVELGPREGMVYISIHANASLSPRAEGYEVWYLPEDYRRMIVDPGTLEQGEQIAPIVNALWEEEFTHESIRLADHILERWGEILGSEVVNRGRRRESWFVVRNARMASVLVELGFVTHPEESVRLRQPAYLSHLTEGLYNGVVDFVTYFENKELSP